MTRSFRFQGRVILLRMEGRHQMGWPDAYVIAVRRKNFLTFRSLTYIKLPEIHVHSLFSQLNFSFGCLEQYGLDVDWGNGEIKTENDRYI